MDRCVVCGRGVLGRNLACVECRTATSAIFVTTPTGGLELYTVEPTASVSEAIHWLQKLEPRPRPTGGYSGHRVPKRILPVVAAAIESECRRLYAEGLAPGYVRSQPAVFPHVYMRGGYVYPRAWHFEH